MPEGQRKSLGGFRRGKKQGEKEKPASAAGDVGQAGHRGVGSVHPRCPAASAACREAAGLGLKFLGYGNLISRVQSAQLDTLGQAVKLLCCLQERAQGYAPAPHVAALEAGGSG